MTSVAVPDNDLAPNMPSRVVTISATNVTEGGTTDGGVTIPGKWVNFALSDTIDVTPGGDVIARTSQTVTLNSAGNGSIRLPVYDTSHGKGWEHDKDWAIIVTTSWGSTKAIRVPAGAGDIPLSQIPAVRPLSRNEMRYAISGVSITVGVSSNPGQASGTATLDGGILRLGLTVPPTGPHTHLTSDISGLQSFINQSLFYRGVLPDGTDLNSVKATGLYILSSANTYLNRPTASGSANVNATLYVGSQGSTWATQMFLQHGPIAIFQWRSTYSSTAWNAWQNVSNGSGRGELPANTNVDLMRGPTWGGSWSINGTTTTGTMSGTLPPGHTGWQPGQIVINGNGGGSTNLSSQMYMPYTAVGSRSIQVWYRTIDRYSLTGAEAWSAWVNLAAGGSSDPVDLPVNALATGSRDMRLQLFRDAYPLKSTGGKGCVVFRYDHGLTNFKSTLLPLHQQYGIVPYVAMNSRNWGLAENSGATQAEAKTWNVEWGNHTSDHNDKTGIQDVWDTIVNGRIELEDQLGKTVHGFTVPGLPGADGNSYSKLDGFNVGYAQGYSNSYAGSLILNHHAICSGVIGPQHRVIPRVNDGNIPIGMRHWGWENRAWDGTDGIKALIDEAVSTKTALTLMQHPRTMNLSGYWTPALAEQVISYVRQLIDAGDLANVSYMQSHRIQLDPL